MLLTNVEKKLIRMRLAILGFSKSEAKKVWLVSLSQISESFKQMKIKEEF